jgi:hypothetical protein
MYFCAKQKKANTVERRLELSAELMKRVFVEDVCLCRNCGLYIELLAVMIR